MTVNEFWQQKYRNEASKNWHRFYQRNQNRFFKDRHWLQREFPELSQLAGKTLFEVGCGVGNLVFPMFESEADLKIVCADFAKSAIDIIKADQRYESGRIMAHVHDFCQGPLLNVGHVDVSTLIFVLSAVPPEKQVTFLQNLKDSGVKLILFRDYAAEDAAQKRFSDYNKLSEELFVRQDGTLAYYFTEDHLVKVAEEAGFIIQDVQTVQSETVNVKENLRVGRRFLQCRLLLKE